MKTGNIGKSKKKAPPWGDMAGPDSRAVGRMGIGATKPLHIASRRWDHDGSEKGALSTGNASPTDRVAPRGGMMSLTGVVRSRARALSGDVQRAPARTALEERDRYGRA